MTTDKQQLKTVIITGGASGIGLETARFLIETGNYRLVLLGRDRNKLDDAVRLLSKLPQATKDSVSAISCDLKDSQQIKKAIEKIAGSYKGIYGLINNAGIYPFGGLADTSEKTWDEALAVNLKGPFLLTQAVVAMIAKGGQGGRVINISSTAGILPNHFALAYSISKAALIHMTKTLAKELGKDEITVNCICPGIVRSPLHDAYHNSESEAEEFYAKRGATFPLGRVGEPKDVAGAVRFFMSPEAAWVTGDVFVIDGGRLLL